MRGFAWILLSFFALTFYSQNPASLKVVKNLVPNGSFENYRKKSDDIRKAVPWTQIETVDYYHKPLDNDTTQQKGAFEGNCYTGFRFRKKYKEFLQVRLVESLHRGTVYRFSMQIRLAYWSNASLRSFGALITKGGYKNQKDATRGNIVDSISTAVGLHNNYRWIQITGVYKADGGEKFLTIGNFVPIIKKDMIRIDVFRFGAKEAYYFVDDISLIRAVEFDEKIAVERVGPDYQADWQDSTLVVRENITVGETVSLNNISFVNGKYYLLPESYVELNKLAYYLLQNPEIEIRINGHSDNSGRPAKNQKISELRAREVFEYLIKKGVQNKLYFKGFGSTKPVADNNTEEGRARNRRVEFEIIKK